MRKMTARWMLTSYQKGDGYIKYCINDMVREPLVNETDITTITLHRPCKNIGRISQFSSTANVALQFVHVHQT